MKRNLKKMIDVAMNGSPMDGVQDAEPADTFDYAKIDATFRKYANLKEDRSLCEVSDRMGPNGVMKFLSDLGIDPASLSALILAWKFEAETQCEFAQAEFRKGFRKFGVSTVPQLKRKLPAVVEEALNNKTEFESLYRFTFEYARPASSKTLDLETASNYWRLVLSRMTDHRIYHWIMFLTERSVAAISQDTWNMFLHFLWQNNPQLTNYDLDYGCWPVLMDDFVENLRLVHKDDYPTPDSN
ncbi:Defective in cullin neddylation protein [Aphelenchoides fujianensis]|nr:Defective in cullin neddylation protein [Aphelenchoides fujianensis]